MNLSLIRAGFDWIDKMLLSSAFFYNLRHLLEMDDKFYLSEEFKFTPTDDITKNRKLLRT